MQSNRDNSFARRTVEGIKDGQENWSQAKQFDDN